MEPSVKSSYVDWSDRNVAARSSFFASLAVDQLADDMKNLDNLGRTPKRPQQKRVPGTEPTRKSGRLSSRTGDFEKVKQVNGNLWWRDDAATEKDNSREDMAKIVGQCIENCPAPSSGFATPSPNVNNIAIVSGFSVVTTDGSKVHSLAVHPSETTFLLACGKNNGRLLLLAQSLTNNDDPAPALRRQFQITNATSGITALSFTSSSLILAGGDGKVSEVDLSRLNKTAPSEHYAIEDVRITDMANGDSSNDEWSFWVSQDNGDVVLVDKRQKGASACYSLNESGLTSISYTPSAHKLCSASYDGQVAIWDVRSMTSSPLSTWQHDHRVNSVSFHPRDPSLVLSFSRDNLIRVLNVDGGNCSVLWTAGEETKKRISSWNVVWRPSWLPKTLCSDGNAFVMGSEGAPIWLFSDNEGTGKFHRRNLSHPKFLPSAAMQIAFHPTLPLLVNCHFYTRVAVDVVRLEEEPTGHI